MHYNDQRNAAIMGVSIYTCVVNYISNANDFGDPLVSSLVPPAGQFVI